MEPQMVNTDMLALRVPLILLEDSFQLYQVQHHSKPPQQERKDKLGPVQGNQLTSLLAATRPELFGLSKRPPPNRVSVHGLTFSSHDHRKLAHNLSPLQITLPLVDSVCGIRFPTILLEGWTLRQLSQFIYACNYLALDNQN